MSAARRGTNPPMQPIEQLEHDIAAARADPARFPKTARLLAAGIPKQAKKMVEEAAELAIEAVRHDREAAVREAADLLYNLLVLLKGIEIGVADICQELERRRATYGIAGKEPKPARAPAGSEPSE